MLWYEYVYYALILIKCIISTIPYKYINKISRGICRYINGNKVYIARQRNAEIHARMKSESDKKKGVA